MSEAQVAGVDVATVEQRFPAAFQIAQIEIERMITDYPKIMENIGVVDFAKIGKAAQGLVAGQAKQIACNQVG